MKLHIVVGCCYPTIVSKLKVYKSNICSIIKLERSKLMLTPEEFLELYNNASEEDQEFVLMLLSNSQPSPEQQGERYYKDQVFPCSF